jgi:hypothetical protein
MKKVRLGIRLLRCLVITGVTLALASCVSRLDSGHVVIRVIDEETGRGVPLVELTLLNQAKYWTDSAGVAVLDEPALLGQEAFIEIRSHGYEYPQSTIFGVGAVVRLEPGRIEELSIRRTMVAERLYRLTGEGIYRDSVMAGLSVPLEEPLLNAQVLGQDTVSTAIYRGRIFWIWGDTIGPISFNGSVAAATSSLDDDPASAINYRYFTDSQGRTKRMLPLTGGGLVWIEGLVTIDDPAGNERLIATYTRQDGLQFPDECGLALYDDTAQVFEPWVRLPCTRNHKSSHPVLHDAHWYFYPWLRVPDDWNAIQDSARWEALELEIAADAGSIVSKEKISAIAWNEYRQRWIVLIEDFGDVYYAEALAPEGPYGDAVQIIEHDRYNFYNVATHHYFNRDGGRTIFLEGTYTDSFTDAPMKTPRYNYNQIMYRLNLDDPRLRPAQE